MGESKMIEKCNCKKEKYCSWVLLFSVAATAIIVELSL
jgi:hypothetical protein